MTGRSDLVPGARPAYASVWICKSKCAQSTFQSEADAQIFIAAVCRLCMSCRALMDAEYYWHAETDFQADNTTGNLTLTTRCLERRLCQEEIQILTFYLSAHNLILFKQWHIYLRFIISSNVKNVKTWLVDVYVQYPFEFNIMSHLV